jgi:hypothetical protein
MIFSSRDALCPLLLKSALIYAISNVQENQVELKLNGNHQLQAYCGDVNLLGDNMNTIKKNTGTLIDASKQICLEANAIHSGDVGLNHDIKIANRASVKTKKSNSRSACYSSIQKLYLLVCCLNMYKLEYTRL